MQKKLDVILWNVYANSLAIGEPRNYFIRAEREPDEQSKIGSRAFLPYKLSYDIHHSIPITLAYLSLRRERGKAKQGEVCNVSFPQSLKRKEKARREKRILANFAVISLKHRPMGSEMQLFFWASSSTGLSVGSVVLVSVLVERVVVL